MICCWLVVVLVPVRLVAVLRESVALGKSVASPVVPLLLRLLMVILEVIFVVVVMSACFTLFLLLLVGSRITAT